MKRIRKEYLVFLSLIILVLLIFGIFNYKSNKPKYDKSKVHITFNSETENSTVSSNTASTEPSLSDNVTESVIEETEQSTEFISESSTEAVQQPTESTTEEMVGDMYAVNSSNIYDIISNILSASPNLEYCTKDFKYDESIKNQLEIFRVSELENHFDEGYVLGYIETPVDDLPYRFDFTLNDNKLASLTFSKQ